MEYGIPIVNKRVAVTPIALVAGASQDKDYVKYAKTLDKAAQTLGIDFIGGFSALVQKGMTKGDKTLIALITRSISTNEFGLCLSQCRFQQKWDQHGCSQTNGEVITTVAKLDYMTNAKLVVFCNAVEDNPFMAGGFHGVSEPDVVINVGVSGPGVVKSRFRTC